MPRRNEEGAAARCAVALVLMVLVGAALTAQDGPQGAGTEVIDELEIYQYGSVIKEGKETHWVVRLDKRPVKTGTGGYRPASAEASSWEPPVDFHWNFGDGTGWISTGERPSITHRYMKLGPFVLQVEARSPAGKVEGSLPVLVSDQDYSIPSMNAIEVDPARSTYELTADIRNPSQEEVTVKWDFGEEIAKQEGPDLWKVTQSFPPGRRKIKVTWEGDDGTEREKSFDLFPEVWPDFSGLDLFDAQVVAEGVRTRFEGSFSGGLPTSDLRAAVRPFAGLLLGPTSKGQCRFMMTAWDPELLVMVQLIANVPGLPEEGWRFQYPASIASLSAKPNAAEYLTAHSKSGFNESLRRRLGEEERLEGFSERDVNKELRRHDAGFVQLGEREAQYVNVGEGSDERRVLIRSGAPADVSSLISKEESYGGHTPAASGTVQLHFVPHDRVVGVLDLRLEGGSTYDRLSCVKGRPYKGGMCKRLALQGRFVLDLEAAKRDGLVRYDGCAPDPKFAIDALYGPELSERHVSNRQPRLVASFTSKVDPATLNDSTFQLGYVDRSGRFVRIEARMHRDEDSVFLKPVEELWGGVGYLTRVKIGDRGVRGLNGGFLKEDEMPPDTSGAEGDDWFYLHDFFTRIEFGPKSGRPHNLSCHVWQGARDAPLIVGKPAVAQVHASWTKNPRFLDSRQVANLTARVILEKKEASSWVEINRIDHTFKRPDLAPPPDEESKHTANILFTPDRSTPKTLRVSLEVSRNTAEDTWRRYYTTLCSTPVWKHEPELRIALVSIEGYYSPEMEPIAETLASVLPSRFPLRRVSVQTREPLVLHSGQHFLQRVERTLRDRAERERTWRLEGGEGAVDLVAGVSESYRLYHWTLASEFGQADPAFVFSTAVKVLSATGFYALDSARITGSLMHQIGHALGLPDVPHGGLPSASPADHVWEGGAPLEWHDGFEHALYSSSEQFFFSSRHGGWPQLPIMHPTASSDVTRLPLRHHYLQMMEAIEDSELARP